MARATWRRVVACGGVVAALLWCVQLREAALPQPSAADVPAGASEPVRPPDRDRLAPGPAVDSGQGRAPSPGRIPEAGRGLPCSGEEAVTALAAIRQTQSAVLTMLESSTDAESYLRNAIVLAKCVEACERLFRGEFEVVSAAEAASARETVDETVFAVSLGARSALFTMRRESAQGVFDLIDRRADAQEVRWREEAAGINRLPASRRSAMRREHEREQVRIEEIHALVAASDSAARWDVARAHAQELARLQSALTSPHLVWRSDSDTVVPRIATGR